MNRNTLMAGLLTTLLPAFVMCRKNYSEQETNVLSSAIVSARAALSADTTAVVTLTSNGYVSPSEGNGYGNITGDGLQAWTSSQGITRTWFLPQATGQLKIALLAKSPESNSKIRVTIGTKTFETTINKRQQYDTVQVGTVDVTATAYTNVSVQGVSKTGSYYPDIKAVLLSGPAASGLKYNTSVYRSAPATHLSYPVPAGNQVEWFYNEITVPQGADPLYSYYMVCGFSGGYFGIQVNSPTERRVLFSVWSAYSTDDPSTIPAEYRVKLLKKGSNVTTNDFGNEGSGGQSYWKFNWKVNTTYKLLLHAVPGADNTVYTAYFYAPENNGWKLLASWDKPKSGGAWLGGLYSFVENFGSNGEKLFRAQFGNQWVKTSAGNWVELTKSSFSTTADPVKHPRYDRGAGLINNQFYMFSGGFGEVGTTQRGEVITRNANGQAPNISGLPTN